MKVYLLLILSLFFARASALVIIPYGSSGKIVYDLRRGTYTVSDQRVLLLKDCIARVENNGIVLNSREYVSRKYFQSRIKDAFGIGTKHIILLKAPGKPDLKQVFYTYPQLPYFLCEVEMLGQELSSNAMSPLLASVMVRKKMDPTSLSADWRTLFVPFDNDTFVRYDAPLINAVKEMVSAEVGALYLDASRHGLVIGSVTHEVWKTGVRTVYDLKNGLQLEVLGGYTEKSLTRDTISHGLLSGKSICSPKVFFGLFSDWRKGMESYARANRKAEPPIVQPWKGATPIGWNSWGAMQDKITFEKATAVASFFADSLKGFRSGGTAFIDLDSYWDKMLVDGLAGNYSVLKRFATQTKKKGLKPGVYWAPFVDWGFQSGPARMAEGTNYKFGELWTKTGSGYHNIDGARALDPTHPGTQQRIALVIRKLKECGFEMIKIDFLGHAAIESTHFYNPKVTTGMQAYRIGMEYLVKQINGKMLIYAAISPSMASGRYVNMRRIACDAFKSVKDSEYTLNSVTNGWWQSYLYDYLDADHVVLGNESKGANVIRVLSALVTGTWTTGDDFSINGPWRFRAVRWYQNPMLLEVIRDGKAFRPVSGTHGKEFSPLFIKESGRTFWLALFNMEGSEKKYEVNLARLGLSTSGKYIAEVADFDGSSKAISAATFSNHQTLVVRAGNAILLRISRKSGIQELKRRVDSAKK
jgi:alpha-galactosidase